jgi:hypothetical protein
MRGLHMHHAASPQDYPKESGNSTPFLNKLPYLKSGIAITT